MTLSLRKLIIIICFSLVANKFASADSARNLGVMTTGEKRVALVIGNAAYPGMGSLKNPTNDAQDIAAKLKRFGFEVIVRTDVRQKEMLRALTEFGDKIQPGSEALFFYAGHGMQVRGKNYLIPIDAEIRTEAAVSSEAVDVEQLLDKLSPARLSLVILDACRNNPFERRFRGGGQGLAQINAPTGTLIAYSTAPGKVAADGEGRNGLYTAELLAAMEAVGTRIEDVFKRVRANVVRKSGESQTPWESSSLTGDFYFRSQGPGSLHAVSATAAPVDANSVELTFWESIKNSDDAGDFQAYVEKYPNGQFIALAERRAKNKRPPGPTVANEMRPGMAFKDCDDCPEMVIVPPGSFDMGTNNGDSDETPIHTVRIAKPFAIGKTEVTQRQWRALMGGNPSGFKDCGDDCPIENITWDSARRYVQALAAKTGKAYRLPTEAEWEYACRAGGRHDYCGGDIAEVVAWFEENANRTTHRVAGRTPNQWGLYDMSGNVWEWVEDCYHGSYENAPVDGTGWTADCSKDQRILRGGSWYDSMRSLRLTRRSSWGGSSFKFSNLGFRVARDVQ